jgi:3',5'-cyclic AMP phosphodiesterase CpdA
MKGITYFIFNIDSSLTQDFKIILGGIKMKKTLKKGFIICFTIIIIYLLYTGLTKIKIIGQPSTELWFKTDQLNIDNYPSLEMEGDEFTILLLSDLQLETNPFEDNKTLLLMDELVNEVKPDLILTTGDNTSWSFANFETKKLIKHLESYQLPWSVVLGNHDSEGMADRNWHGNQYENAKYSLFSMGPSTIHGVGNHIINITEDGDIFYSLILFDSHASRIYKDGQNYDFIYPDQIEWYEWYMDELMHEEGNLIKSMMFLHIPLPEYLDAEKYPMDAFGVNNETITAPPINSGLFDKVLEYKSTSHIFVGHDHINSLSSMYKGVRLTYGLKTGMNSYANKDQQGATVITISEDNVDVKHLYKN